MKLKPKKPPVPAERHETLRREIVEILEGRTLSAAEFIMSPTGSLEAS